MNNDFMRLAVLLSILLLIVFPFAGLAPLLLIVFAAVFGWMLQLAGTVIGATEPEDIERT